MTTITLEIQPDMSHMDQMLADLTLLSQPQQQTNQAQSQTLQSNDENNKNNTNTNNVLTTTASTPSFLSLPPEILNRIYLHHFLASGGPPTISILRLRSNTHSILSGNNYTEKLSLLQTSRDIYADALSVFRSLELRLSCAGNVIPHEVPYGDISLTTRERIGCLEIKFESVVVGDAGGAGGLLPFQLKRNCSFASTFAGLEGLRRVVLDYTHATEYGFAKTVVLPGDFLEGEEVRECTFWDIDDEWLDGRLALFVRRTATIGVDGGFESGER